MQRRNSSGRIELVLWRPIVATHRIWMNMKLRCAKVENKNYGGRGIKVCERWMLFENFLEDMGLKPEGKSLDRIDNDGNYSPENCRWATKFQQNRNRRSNRLETIAGETLPVAEWAERFGLNKGTLVTRLLRGMTIYDALHIPLKKPRGKQVKDAAQKQ